MSEQQSSTENNYRLPSNTTLQHASKIGIVEDKPIMLDYWNDSTENKALIGVKNNEEQEKILIKNEDEYTSPISKIYKTEKEYIIITENSIYLVSNEIATKRVS